MILSPRNRRIGPAEGVEHCASPTGYGRRREWMDETRGNTGSCVPARSPGSARRSRKAEAGESRGTQVRGGETRREPRGTAKAAKSGRRVGAARDALGRHAKVPGFSTANVRVRRITPARAGDVAHLEWRKDLGQFGPTGARPTLT